jgi:hypothetical protein
MIDIEEQERQFIADYQNIAEREYQFTLINLPGSPWNLKIRAIKNNKRPGFYTECSLGCRKANEATLYFPHYSLDDAERAIKLTLIQFLSGNIIEIGVNKNYKK